MLYVEFQAQKLRDDRVARRLGAQERRELTVPAGRQPADSGKFWRQLKNSCFAMGPFEAVLANFSRGQCHRHFRRQVVSVQARLP